MSFTFFLQFNVEGELVERTRSVSIQNVEFAMFRLKFIAFMEKLFIIPQNTNFDGGGSFCLMDFSLFHFNSKL